jgi:hypothetical protein
MWVAEADCCLFSKTVSHTPGLSIDCCVVSSNSSVASPPRAATKQFLLFLVVACCLAHGFDMTPPVHSEVLSSVVNMLLPVVHSAVTSPLLPSACWVHCLYLLLCLSTPVVLMLFGCSVVQSACCRLLASLLLSILPVVPDLFPCSCPCRCQSFSRRAAAYYYRLLLFALSCGDSLLLFVLPVVPDFNPVVCRFSLLLFISDSRTLPRSSFFFFFAYTSRATMALLRFVVCIVPMATMALSVMVVDGHNGTVDSCFFLFKNPLLWCRYRPVLFLLVVLVTDGHHGTVRFRFVRIVLPVDGHIDTVDCCCCSCCPPRWTSSLISSSLGTFWLVFVDGHNDTVDSCFVPLPVVATIALPLL